MKNKNGKGNNLLVGFIILIAVVGIGFWYVSQDIGGGSVTDVGRCSDSTGTVTINNFSELVGGADPSATYTAGVIKSGDSETSTIVASSVTSGTTTFAVGDKVVLFGSASNYIDKYEVFTMKCGGSVVDFPMKYSTSDNPSIRIKNDDGDFMTDSSVGGATNQTNLATGETLNLEVEFQGTNGESSGEGVYIVEFPASTSANITSVLLNGQSPVAVPTVHSSANAGSKIVAFDVPAVNGATKNTMTLSIVLGSGKDLSGGVLTDWYAKQWFIDDDKTLKYGVQDSDGTAKYENTLDYDFFINSA